MSNRALLIGLDFGTTTSCAVVASAVIACNSVTGRVELSDIREQHQSEQVFTPFIDDRLDEARLAGYLDDWLGRVDSQQVFGGGALITGLAAQKTNAVAFARQVRRHLKDAIIAVASDPCLESWLAFMGNCADLSRTHAERLFVNLDIGGGTTNIAAGRRGEVLGTGSLYVGARHIQVAPGSYQIRRLSPYARALLDHLAIRKVAGDHLVEQEVSAIVDWYLGLLEDAVRGTLGARSDPVAAMHQQVRFELPAGKGEVALTVSGGVGQLVYAGLQGAPRPATTAFGDLGIDIAMRMAETPFWRRHLQDFRPTTLGRATVYGLLRYSTQVSGSTIYLAEPKLLPLGDLVILGTIGPSSSQSEIEQLLALGSRAPGGACLWIDLDGQDLAGLRNLSAKMQRALERQPVATQFPLVLFLRENLGKVFGQYLTNWGTSFAQLIVVDEIDRRDAQFARLGAMREQVVPVSLYGMTPSGAAP